MSEITPITPKPHAERLRIIIKGTYEGKLVGEKDVPGTIAYECGVTARTITRDKRSIEFQPLSEIFMEQFLQELAATVKIRDDDGRQIYLPLVLAEKGRLIRALLPRRIEAKAEIRQVIIQPRFNKLIETEYKVIEDDTEP